MSWRVANALKTIEAQLRSEVPGIVLGDIRDPNGTSISDHNPWKHDAAGVGVVRAVDIMHPPNGDGLAANLAAKLGRHPAMKSGAYVIWNRRIMSADRKSEGWRAYTGASPHTDHIHLSIASSQSGYDSRASWGSLTKGGGNLGGVQPAAPPAGTAGTSPLGVAAAYNGAGNGTGPVPITNAALASVAPDVDQLRRLVIYGVALFGGVALIAVGLGKTVKPHTDALISEGQSAVMNLIPQGKAASAAGAGAKTATATKGM